MVRRVFLCGAVIAAAAVTGLWAKKDPDASGTHTMLSHSAWAKQVRVVNASKTSTSSTTPSGGPNDPTITYPTGGPNDPYPPGGYPPPSGRYPGGGYPGGYPGGGIGGIRIPGIGGRGGGIGGRPRGGSRKQSDGQIVTFRWESALPIRQVQTHLDAETTKAIEDWSKTYYVISMTGYALPGTPAYQTERDDQERMKPMQQRLKTMTTLAIKNGPTLKAARVEISNTDVDGRAFYILFPRSSDLSVENKQVNLQTTIGRQFIDVPFDLKSMVVDGKLEL